MPAAYPPFLFLFVGKLSLIFKVYYVPEFRALVPYPAYCRDTYYYISHSRVLDVEELPLNGERDTNKAFSCSIGYETMLDIIGNHHKCRIYILAPHNGIFSVTRPSVSTYVA